MSSTVTGFANGNLAVEARNMHVFYGSFRAVKDVSLKIKTHAITAFIGPVWLRQKHRAAFL
jgi:ABC-type phosphate transport system ATPase subunit